MPRLRKYPAIACSAFILFIALTIQAQVPGTPVLTSPTNGATGRSTTALTLNWATAAGASTYTVQVSQSSAFLTTVISSSNIGSSSLSVTGLAINTTYFWRVDATGAGGTGSWSGAWSFTTVNAVPASPTLTLPTNGAINQPVALNLSWGGLASASTYGVQVSTASTFYSLFSTRSGITGTSVADTFLNATTYYWEANATNPIGTSIWSGIWSFTTGQMTTAPTLVSPTNGAVNQALLLTLSWNSASTATSYRVEVSATSAFSSTISNQAGITGKALAVSGLANNMNYYWRVNADGPYGTSNWSSVYSFATPLAAPGAPTLSSPANGSSYYNGSLTVSLIWGAASGATTYTVQVSEGSTFANTVFNQSGTATSAAYNYGAGKTGDRYWRVNAANSSGTGIWSTVWYFYIQPVVTVVLPERENAGSLCIAGFAHGVLAYNLKEQSLVEVSLFDILGRKIFNFNRMESSGSYAISLKNYNFPAGVYLLQIKAGAIESRMKIVLPGE